MAFGSSSAMFQAFVQSLLEDTATGYNGLETDVIKVALFNNSVTPDKDAAVASTGYGAGTWTTGNEVTHANWAAGGRTLANDAVTDGGTGITQYAADNLAGGGAVDLANVYGCLVYNDDITAGTVVDQGVTYHSFGGAQSVTAGTFTIVWHANGLFRITV